MYSGRNRHKVPLWPHKISGKRLQKLGKKNNLGAILLSIAEHLFWPKKGETILNATDSIEDNNECKLRTIKNNNKHTIGTLTHIGFPCNKK